MSLVLPAEWAPQAFVQLTWPRREGDFAPWFEAVEANFLHIAATIARFEPLLITCPEGTAPVAEKLKTAGIARERVRLVHEAANDVWARDHGPISVLRDGKPLHLDFRFNGWGGKFAAELDDTLTARLAAHGVWPGPVEPRDLVLEGGGIESDGQGTLMATERCLLNPNRNPKITRSALEQKLAHWFGIRRLLWLKHGDLLGDDTDGHIDTLARFCDPGTIAYQGCADRQDPHYETLAAMAEELRGFRQANGAPYRLIELPLPRPILDDEGRRLPAGYANFLIVNGAVLVPTYGDAENDALALARLAPAFPGREIVGVDCRALIHQYGSLHCVTMQLPRGAPP